MTVDDFNAEVAKWIATAKDGRWKRPYTELTYQPMQEVLSYLRANGFKTYIVTGGGQDFVRVYSERVYGIPPEQVVGTMGGTSYSYDKDGKPILTKDPKLLLNDNDAGKPQGIHLSGVVLLPRLATLPAISRCWNTPGPVTVRGLKCSSSTMIRRVNMPMGQPRAFPTPR